MLILDISFSRFLATSELMYLLYRNPESLARGFCKAYVNLIPILPICKEIFTILFSAIFFLGNMRTTFGRYYLDPLLLVYFQKRRYDNSFLSTSCHDTSSLQKLLLLFNYSRKGVLSQPLFVKLLLRLNTVLECQ